MLLQRACSVEVCKLTSVEVATSMHQARQWASIAVPYAVQTLWPRATVHEVENNDHPVCTLLDTQSGIDWLVEYRGRVKGLSVRCQARWCYRYAKRAFRSPTFTVREKRISAHRTSISELEKTIQAVESGAITAVYQLHAYMDVDEGDATSVIAFGLVDRIGLFRWIMNHRDELVQKTTKDTQRKQTQQFLPIPFTSIPDTIFLQTFEAHP